MKTCCCECSYQVVTVTLLLLNVILNGLLTTNTSPELIEILGSEGRFNWILILSETFLSWIAILCVFDKSNTRVIIILKRWLLGFVAMLLFLDIFSAYMIAMQLYEDSLNEREKIEEINELDFSSENHLLLILGLICYSAFKFYVVAKTVTFACDSTNFISTDDYIDVEQNALRSDANDVPPRSPPPAYDSCFIESAPKVLETPPPSYEVAAIFKFSK